MFEQENKYFNINITNSTTKLITKDIKYLNLLYTAFFRKEIIK